MRYLVRDIQKENLNLIQKQLHKFLLVAQSGVISYLAISIPLPPPKHQYNIQYNIQSNIAPTVSFPIQIRL